MKSLRFSSNIFLVALLAFALSFGCSSDDNDDDGGTIMEPPPAFQGITGTVSLRPGVSANLSNARVAVYTSLEDFNNDSFLTQTALTGSSPTWNFQVGPLNPGSYYLDVWLDVNNSGTLDTGDVWGYYTTGTGGNASPIQVLEDETTTITLTIGPVGTAATNLSKRIGK